MLLDTSGLLCLVKPDEPQFLQAKAAFSVAKAMVCHNYVLAELVALSHSRRFSREQTIALLEALDVHPDIDIIWVDRSLHDAAIQLLLERADKTYSLCDAVSFVPMRRLGIKDALTTDFHFEQEGFVRLLR